MDTLEQYARAGLELAGDPPDDTDLAVIRAADNAYGPGMRALDETDLAVIRAADAAYGPAMRALDTVDLTGVAPEPDLDPSRPPRPL